MNPLRRLKSYGQAIWLDNLSRGFLNSGGLETLIERDGLSGMTSNPTIFDKAISEGGDYDEDIAAFAEEGDNVEAIFRRLAVSDIQKAADIFRPVYESSNGADGFVSIEVSPALANDRDGTIAEARDLWQQIGRPNLMVKVPATEEGADAVRLLAQEGLNINITLLFERERYWDIAEAYIAGLEARTKAGKDVSRVASVASFFVSRIDTKVDAELDTKIEHAEEPERSLWRDLKGKVAIANAKLAYQHYKRVFFDPRWQVLAAKGARPQRLLWASTSTKNKAYSDIVYVETLIGPDTVNTMPPETMDAYRDHGEPKATLESGIEEAGATLAALETAGISLKRATAELTVEGIEKFARSADDLYRGIAKKRARLLSRPGGTQRKAENRTRR